MRRLIAFCFLLVYLFFSGSRVIAMHYCGDTLTETRINLPAHCCCETEDEQALDDCCTDIIKPVIQPDCALWKHDFHFDDQAFIPLTTPYFFPVYDALPNTNCAVPSPAYSPPKPKASVPVYIRHHALLFYA